jgi:DNA-binding transcriptional LysR family regulator
MIPELRTFIAVARSGTFAGAGERIGLTQSAVSGQIKRLEEELGFALFDRTGRSATLNAAGQQTLARAEELVGLFARLGEPQEDAAAEGVLRIGAISSMQPSLLARAMVGFRQKFPTLRVRVVPGASLHLLDQLDTGDIEAAIMIRPPFGLMPDLRWQTLLREPFVLAVPKGLKGSDWRALLRTQPFVRYERSSFAGRQVERFLRAQDLQVQDAMELDEVPAMAEMVARGLGVALLPRIEAYAAFFTDLRTIALGEHTFHREIGMMQRRSKAGQLAVDHLARCVAQAAVQRRPRGAPRGAA